MIIEWLIEGCMVDDSTHTVAWWCLSQFKGQIIIPDFGFYALPFHASLIRENRLIAGVFTLSELDEKMRQLCLLMEKEGRQCTPDDAAVLAQYKGLMPKTNEYEEYVAGLTAGLGEP